MLIALITFKEAGAFVQSDMVGQERQSLNLIVGIFTHYVSLLML